MEKAWKILKCEDCPNCGDALEVFSACQEGDDTEFVQYLMDGDDVRCAAGCGFLSAISADDDDVWVQDGNINDLPDSEGGDQ